MKIQAWVTWDVRITSKVSSQDNALKEVLSALPKEQAENTEHLHVGDEWPDQLKRELQLMRHFVVQSACNQRFPRICTLLTDLYDRMAGRDEKNNASMRQLAELAFQGVDCPYLDLFSFVPAEFLSNGVLRKRRKPLWKAQSDELLANQWQYKGTNYVDAFRDADERCVDDGILSVLKIYIYMLFARILGFVKINFSVHVARQDG